MTTAEFMPDESEVQGYVKNSPLWKTIAVELAKLGCLLVFLLELVVLVAVLSGKK